MPNNNTDIYTLDDMLGVSPNWLQNSGMSMLFLTTVGLLSMSWFIQYPDRLTGKAVIQTQYPPVEVVAPSSAVLERLLVDQHEEVIQDQPLGLLENTADWEDIKKVQSWITEPGEIDMDTNMQLGEVQAAYASWKSEWSLYLQAKNNPETANRKAALQKEKEYLQNLNASLERRIVLYEQEVKLIEKDLARTEELHNSGVVSDVVMEQKTNTVLQAQRQHEQLRSECVQNQIRSEQLTNQIIDAEQSRTLRLQELQVRLDAARQQLESVLDAWTQQYIIRAPTNGRLELTQDLSESQFVTAGSALMVISPAKAENPVVARCIIPVQGSGKIAIGQSVQLELPAYPPDEFGRLSGKVVAVAEIPVADEKQQLNYSVLVSLESPLITNYQKEITFQQNSDAVARIITQKRRLLQRLLDQLLTKIETK
ncbi:MAG: HlyD family efflux transporter periplasmic adaptor subunit [Saprospiraceae bacterium]|nr:HlyD family efflux transporter periplasmic adaptor subunit [Lewinella sp.]